jgi:hypothetical protein
MTSCLKFRGGSMRQAGLTDVQYNRDAVGWYQRRSRVPPEVEQAFLKGGLAALPVQATITGIRSPPGGRYVHVLNRKTAGHQFLGAR